VYVILHFYEYQSCWLQPDRALIHRPSEGWVLIQYDGAECPVEIESMHWNQFRWIILNLKGTKDKTSSFRMVFCPGSLSAMDFRSLKRIYLSNK
jgi:hypothetical protein